MYQFLKAVFGLPPDDDHSSSGNNHFSSHTDYSKERIYNDMEDRDNILRDFTRSFGGFDFPLFSDPIEIHRYVDGLLEEMQKKMDFFGFTNNPNLIWEEEKRNIFSSSSYDDESTTHPRSLRDSFLKSPTHKTNPKKEDIDLDGKVKVEDIENLLSKKPGTSQDSNSIVTYAPPNIYSKSVYIKTIKHPDGRVETIKKVRDHTGKEETIVTQDGINDTSKPQLDYPVIPADDASGVSIFKKFFPF